MPGYVFKAMVAVSALVLLCGCETIAQDFNDFTSSLTPKSPREAAVEMFDQYDPDKRREGTLLIANSPFGGTEVYLRAYRDMVQNEQDPLALAVAIRALAKHGEPADAKLIAPHLEHDNEQVRWEAAKGLQRLHNPEVVGLMLSRLRLEDESPLVRRELAVALGQYPEDRVFQGLVQALYARELSVNMAAEQSLETLTGRSLGLDPRPWQRWYNDLDRPELAFEQGDEYLFPTYHRDRRWWEYLAFWSASPVREHPAPPAGLAAEGRRRTYGDNESDAANSAIP